QSGSLAARSQLAQDVGDDVLDRAVDRYCERALVGRGRLEGAELAGEQTRWHEVTLSPAEPVSDQSLCAVEIDQAGVGSTMHQDVAIDPAQRRAADHDMPGRVADTVDLGRDR